MNERFQAGEEIRAIAPDLWQESGLDPAEYNEFLNDLATAKTGQDIAWLVETYCFGKKVPLFTFLEDTLLKMTHQRPGDIDYALLERELPAVKEKIFTIENEAALLAQEYAIPAAMIQSDSYAPTPLHIIERFDGPNERSAATIIAPGCFTGPEQLTEFSVSLAQYGHTVVAPEMFIPHQHQPRSSKEAPIETNVTTAYHESVASTMRFFTEQYGENTFSLVGYSTGAAAVLKAALEQPSAINSIVLIHPIGLTNTSDSDFANKLRVAWGGLRHVIQNSKYENTPAFQKFAAGYAERQSKRGWKEIIDIIETAGEVDIQDILFTLHQAGVRIGIIHGDGDKQFNATTSEKTLGVRDDGTTTRTGSEIWTLNESYTHTSIGRQPQAIAAFVHDGLTHLEEAAPSPSLSPNT
jgi:hypothetical protein